MVLQRYFDVDPFAVTTGNCPDQLAQRCDGATFFADQAPGNSRVALNAKARTSLPASAAGNLNRIRVAGEHRNYVFC
jgi:hypothetical protein